MINKTKNKQVGTTQGILAVFTVFEYNSDLKMKLNFASKIHKPSTSEVQDLKFGSLTKFAEIWSLAWSPDNNFIATTSEDQTTRIVNSSNGETVKILTGNYYFLSFLFEFEKQKKKNKISFFFTKQ